ncbi:autoimmune regulator isoform X2 [Phaenicophaeus curvirostris]|uniref:autoimmune regulator isoform X2 n=1 Tax=Phaenicophaeus curvirostris TaxID=33595 RepID=UPI0037F09C8B
MAGGDGDLRHLLKRHRTEIAMAVDDVFPLLHGLADHDVVPEHVFKETLSRTEREGSQRAFHALLTWLLSRDADAIRDFWAVLFKDYNLERYSRLRPLRGTFPRELELGRQRRSRRLSPSPMVPAPHRPHGKRKAPEERDGAAAAQPSPRHSPGPPLRSRTGKKPEGADAPRTPRAGGGSKMGSRAGDELYAAAACEEPRPRSRSCSLNPPARPRAPQSSGDPRLPAPAAHSDPVPNQENEDECAACGDGGELICCDGCPRAFHLACLVPPLPRVPSGMWRCAACEAEASVRREADVAAERPPDIQGEAAGTARRGAGDGVPMAPQPGADPRALTLCVSCAATPDTGSLASSAVGSEHPPRAAKAEDGPLGGEPGLSRDELDALLGEGAWDGILQWAFQSVARPLADTQGLFA